MIEDTVDPSVKDYGDISEEEERELADIEKAVGEFAKKCWKSSPLRPWQASAAGMTSRMTI